MNLSDMFGPNPIRPNTPEFWALSEIVLKLDGRMEEAVEHGGDRDKVFDAALAEVGMEGQALAYMGMQRAFRALEISTRDDLLRPGVVQQATRMTALYMEAFIVGANYERKRSS